MKAFWNGLQAREKAVIAGGTALVLLTALVLAFSALWQTRAALLAEREQQAATIDWLQEQARLAAGLNNGCPGRAMLSGSSREMATTLVGELPLAMSRLEEISPAAVRIRLAAADGADILRFVHRSACQGFIVERLTLAAAENGEGFSGTVEMRRDG